MRKDNMQKKQEECLAYFRERPIYRKLFQKMRNKYESLGHMGGKVVLTGLSREDKLHLGGFLQKDFADNKTVTVSVEAFEKCLAGSRFSGISLEELLTMYFGSTMTAKKEERQKEIEKREEFFESLWKECKDTWAKEWMKTAVKEHGPGYEMLLRLYRDDPAKLRETVTYVVSAAEQLPGLTGGETELLAVFAAKTTGDPHYFDAGTWAERLLLSMLSAYFQEEKDAELSEAERKNQLFYRAGILKDDLSNDILVYGIRAWKQDGTLHEGIEGFFMEQEPVRLTLRTVGKLGRAGSGCKTIYLLENPAVFSNLIKKDARCAAVCVNGQPRLAALILLDLLKEAHMFYYWGDFDPEGLLIAQRLKERYKDRIRLWNYRADWYDTYLSDVRLSEMRIKKLEKVCLPELKELRAAMEKEGRAAYQEAMMEEWTLNSTPFPEENPECSGA